LDVALLRRDQPAFQSSTHAIGPDKKTNNSGSKRVNDKKVSARLTANNRGLVIDIVGRLSLDIHREFRSVYESSPKCERYAVNLQRCVGIDSSGLGMLLILRDFAGLNKDNMLIVNCPSRLGKLLGMAKFDQLFTVQNLNQAVN